VIVNDIEPPQSVLDEIKRHGCLAQYYQRDFDMKQTESGQSFWQSGDISLSLNPELPGIHQRQNLAGVVAGLHQLFNLSSFEAKDVQANFRGTELAGRFQLIKTGVAADVYIDVGHNADAARALAKNLSSIKKSGGRVVVLLGMLDDKDNAAFVGELLDVVNTWWLLTLDADRGLSADCLAERIAAQLKAEQQFDNANNALDQALSSLGNQDIMLVTGSFVTVEHFLVALS
jgi:dihydrofolate synthase/folylpolyglutamate synthase